MGVRGRPRHPDVLTPREWDVFHLMRQRHTNEEIARTLGISLDGAKYHVSSILSKLGVTSRFEAVSWEPAQAGGRRSWGLIFALAKLAGAGLTAAAIFGVGALGYGVVMQSTSGTQTEHADAQEITPPDNSGDISSSGDAQTTDNKLVEQPPTPPADQTSNSTQPGPVLVALPGPTLAPGDSNSGNGGTQPTSGVSNPRPTPTPTFGAGGQAPVTPKPTPHEIGDPAGVDQPTPTPTATPPAHTPPSTPGSTPVVTPVPTDTPTPEPTDVPPSPVETEQPEPSVTPEPTQTFEPMETPQPSVTPEPRETPQPSETPEPGATPEVEAVPTP